jgi:hypothetical protein
MSVIIKLQDELKIDVWFNRIDSLLEKSIVLKKKIANSMFIGSMLVLKSDTIELLQRNFKDFF